MVTEETGAASVAVTAIFPLKVEAWIEAIFLIIKPSESSDTIMVTSKLFLSSGFVAVIPAMLMVVAGRTAMR